MQKSAASKYDVLFMVVVTIIPANIAKLPSVARGRY
jgi:hypothetical protein